MRSCDLLKRNGHYEVFAQLRYTQGHGMTKKILAETTIAPQCATESADSPGKLQTVNNKGVWGVRGSLLIRPEIQSPALISIILLRNTYRVFRILLKPVSPKKTLR